MRISTNMMFESGARRISELQSSLLKTQEKISANRRILTPADDPTAAARVLEVSQSQSMNTQYAENRTIATSSLKLEDSILDSITDLIQDVQTRIVEAGDGAYDADQRKYIANDLRGRLAELTGYANTRDNEGNYMFAGYKTANQPFSSTTSGTVYNGDQGSRSLQVGSARNVPISHSGDSVFMRITNNSLYESGEAVSNTGTAEISSLTIDDLTQLTRHEYNIAYERSTNQFTVSDLTLGTSQTVAYTGDPQTLTFDGLRMTVSGTVADGDVFLIRQALTDDMQSLSIPNTNGYFATNTLSTNGGAATISPYSVVNSTLLTGHEYNIVYDDTVPQFVVTDLTTSGTVNIPAAGDPQTLNFDGIAVTIGDTASMVNGDTFTIRHTAAQFVTDEATTNTGSGTISPYFVTDTSALTRREYDIVYESTGVGTGVFHVTDPSSLAAVIDIPYAGTDTLNLSFEGVQFTIGNATTLGDGDTFTVRQSPDAQPAYLVSGASVDNVGTGSVSPLSIANDELLTGHEYEVTYDATGTQFDITDLTTGATLTSIAYTGTPQTITFDGLQMTISGTLVDGDVFSVREALVAGEAPILVEDGSQSVFDMMDDLIATLESSNTLTDLPQQELANNLAVANANFSNVLDHILTIRASVGARLKEVESLDSSGENRDLQYTETISNLQDLDYVKAISELTLQKTTLDAAQQSYVKIMNLSLFQYL